MQLGQLPWSTFGSRSRNVRGKSYKPRVLRALDGDLPDMQRLVHATAVSPGFAEILVALEEPDRRIQPSGWSWNSLALATEQPLTDVVIPPLMWPTWANPLGVDHITDPSALQRGLADALRVAGVGVEGGTAELPGSAGSSDLRCLGLQNRRLQCFGNWES